MLQALRSLAHALAILAITFWGLFTWPLPWPGLLTGIGALVLTVLIWALFLSPRPVLHTDRFGQSLIELLLIAGAVASLLALGVNWVVAAVLGVAAAVIGYLANSKR